MTWVATAAMLLAAAGTAYNTNRTAKKQDDQATAGIIQSASRQRQATEKVDQSVQDMESSRSGDEAGTRLESYLDALRRGKGATEAGLTPAIGSDTFRADASTAAAGVDAQAQGTAGLLSRMDAPGMQRQGEAFGYGNLATEVGLIGKESQSDAWINQLRMNSIKRNPWIDAAATGLNAYAGASAGAGGGGGMAKSPQYTPIAGGGRAVYGSTGGGGLGYA